MDTISHIFPTPGRISRPKVGGGAKPDVPTTDQKKEKEKQTTLHACRRLKKKPFAAQDLRVMLQRAGNYTPETKLDTSLLHSHQTL